MTKQKHSKIRSKDSIILSLNLNQNSIHQNLVSNQLRVNGLNQSLLKTKELFEVKHLNLAKNLFLTVKHSN